MGEQVVKQREFLDAGFDEGVVAKAQAEVEPKVYIAEDIQRFLGLGKSKTYEYLQDVYKQQEPFRVIKIGKLFRIPKTSFDNWIYGKEEM